MNRLPFIGYVIGTLLLVSGCLCGAGIISTLIPMYVGVGIIAVSVIGKAKVKPSVSGKEKE